MARTRVLVADAQPIVRLGLRALVEKEPSLEVVGHTADGRALLRLARQLAPTCLLLAPPLPGPPTGELLALLAAERPDPGVLLVVPRDEGKGLLTLPATGLAQWGEAPEDLLHLLRRVATGRASIGPRLLSWLSRRVPEAGLTRREREILALVLLGWENARIAAALDLGTQTVRNYASRVYARLAVHSRAEASSGPRRAGSGSPQPRCPPQLQNFDKLVTPVTRQGPCNMIRSVCREERCSGSHGECTAVERPSASRCARRDNVSDTGSDPTPSLLKHGVPGHQVVRHHTPRGVGTDDPAEAIEHLVQ